VRSPQLKRAKTLTCNNRNHVLENPFCCVQTRIPLSMRPLDFVLRTVESSLICLQIIKRHSLIRQRALHTRSWKTFPNRIMTEATCDITTHLVFPLFLPVAAAQDIGRRSWVRSQSRMCHYSRTYYAVPWPKCRHICRLLPRSLNRQPKLDIATIPISMKTHLTIIAILYCPWLFYHCSRRVLLHWTSSCLPYLAFQPCSPRKVILSCSE
jgi:hypothetical protein